MKVWLSDAISEEDVWFVGDSRWQDSGNAGGQCFTCAHPSKKCRGRIRKPPDTDWWILIETSPGKPGWTRESEHFGTWTPAVQLVSALRRWRGERIR
jgi:hypothetical protein